MAGASAPVSLEKTMKIQIIGGTVVNGKIRNHGEVVEVTDRDARFLITLNKAKKYVEPKPVRRPRARRAPVNRMIDESEVDTR